MIGRGAALGGLLRSAARLDRTQSDPVVALRNAVGVVAPLVIGTLVGAPSSGLAATVGALQTAFADRPGPYRLRALRMLGTAVTASITGGLAVLLSRSDAGSVALLLVLAFLAGLLLAGGPSATQVGVAGTAAALVLGHLPQGPADALPIAALVLAGGVGQTLLAVAAWPLGRHRPERVALAGLYRELAGTARSPGGPREGPQATTPVDTARQTLYGLGHDHGPSVEAYRVLLDEAERIRREVIVLAALTERLAGDRDPIDAGLVRAALGAAGEVLDEVAAALTEGRRIDPGVLTPARGHVRRAVARLDEPGPARGELTRRAASTRLRALAGQLRAVVETSTAGASEGGRSEAPDLRGGFALRDPIAVLRANLDPGSAVFRHALRLSVLVAGSDLVVRLLDLGRGYWVPLTVLVVLRPDFATTFQRGVMRVVGTVVGLVLATELLHWVPGEVTGGQWYRIALLGVFASGCASPVRAISGSPPSASAAWWSSCSRSTASPPARRSSTARSRPRWAARSRSARCCCGRSGSASFVPARLGDLLAAYRSYLETWPTRGPGTVIGSAPAPRHGCARTNAQASVDRAAGRNR